MLVGVEDDILLLQVNGDRNDLVLEASAVYGCDRLLLGSIAERVLFLAGDVVFLRDVLRGHAHMDVGAGIGQCVIDHVVNNGEVTHLVSGTRIGRDQIRRSGHALYAAGNDDVVEAALDGHHCLHDGSQTGSADHVHGMCAYGFRNAGFQRDGAADVLAQSCTQHVSADDLIYVFRCDVCVFQQSLDDCGTHVLRFNGR